MANGRPTLPGVGTQSRIADVQIAQSRLSQQQEEANRRSGLALLGLLSNTGINVADLIQRAREAGARREFQREERLGGQDFQAGQADLGRQFAAEQARIGREARAGEAQTEREFARGERIAGQQFTTGRDEALAQQAAKAATLVFQRQKELAEAQRQLLPQQNFDEAVQQTVGAVTEGLIAKREAGQPVDPAAEQATIDAAVGILSRNFPQEAQNSPVARDFLQREARRQEVETRRAQRDPFGFQAERATELEAQRPALDAAARAAERRRRVQEINRRFREGQLDQFSAERLLESIGRGGFLEIPEPTLRPSRQPLIFP